MQVKELNQPTLFVTEWARFLWRSSVILATILLGSALIMAIAANWLAWPKWGRIALLETILISLTGVTWWLASRKPKDWARAFSLSSLALGLSAICLGGLLALIGQSYQTGADPWQLFALWAVLLLPWAIGLSSLFIILLVVVLTNVALVLLFNGALLNTVDWFLGSSAVLAAGLLVNSLGLGASLYLDPKIDDEYRVWPRVSLLFLAGYGVLWFSDVNAFFAESLLSNIGKPLSGIVFFGLLMHWFRQKQNDFFSAVVCLLAAFYCAVWAVYAWLDYIGIVEDLFFLLVLLTGFAGLFGLRLVIKQVLSSTDQEQKKPSELNSTALRNAEPWYLRLALVAVQFFMVAAALLFTYSHGLLFLFEKYIVVFQAITAAMILLLISKHSRGNRYNDFAFFLFVFAVFVTLIEGSFFNDALSYLRLFWLTALVLVIGVASKRHWLLQFACTVVAVSLLLVWLDTLVWQKGLLAGIYSAQVVFFLWLVCSLTQSYVLATRERLNPLWWALSSMMVVLLTALMLFSDDLAYKDTNVLFTLIALSVPIAGIYRSVALVPTALSILFLGGVSGLWLWSVPMANFALAIGLFGYATQQPSRWWFATLLLLAALGQHYYALHLPLLNKAYLLTMAGTALLLASLGLYFVYLRTQSKASLCSLMLPHRVVWALFGGLAISVVLTSYDVYKKEELIANGDTVILRLAPVDPRSLMQGDYMALAFALSSGLSALESNSTSRYLLYFDPEKSIPSTPKYVSSLSEQQWWRWLPELSFWEPLNAAPDVSALTVLRMQYKKRQWLPNGIDAWFFAESEAAYYEQAEYGVFKSAPSGKALLVDMLDKNAQPMAARANEWRKAQEN